MSRRCTEELLNMNTIIGFLPLFGLALAVQVGQAQFAVAVSPPKVTGSKAVVRLAMKNGLGEKVESARAAVFLLDAQGKMVGQSTKWVIGGSRGQPPLAPGATNVFNFVMTAPRPFPSTNLTARVQFSRVVLEGGKLADPLRDVEIAK
jgi:hypothetical protein